MIYDVIVIGGGQAGLAAGYHLKRATLNFLILEAGDQPVGSWLSYYSSLKLFSPAAYSSLPGLPFPGQGNHYPTRDEVVSYLTSYAQHFQLPIQTQTRVEKVERQGNEFCLTTSNGDEYRASSIIAATGSFSRPNIPAFPGQDAFVGQIIHSSDYRCPTPFAGKRVVVVGGGNSAVQIAVELAEVADVTLATRRPLKFTNQMMLGKDIHFWGAITGLDRLRIAFIDNNINILDTGIYRRAIAAGRPDRRPMFRAFTQTGLIWSDGTHESVDTVILATGYQPNLNYLAALGALAADGSALHSGGISRTVPGLYYVGLSYQRSNTSATLRAVGRDAQYVVRHLKNYLR